MVINMAYTNNEIKDSIMRVSNFIKTNKRNPNTVKVGKNTLKLIDYLKLPQIVDGKNRVDKWIKDHKGIFPNYVTIMGYNFQKAQYKILWNMKETITSTPPTTIFNNKNFKQSEYVQNIKYYCACNMLQLAFYKLTGIWVKESIIAGWAGTTTAGTGHSGIELAVKKFNSKYKTNLKITWKNFSDLSWKQQGEYLASAKHFLFYHLCYHNRSNGGYGSKGYGHYETLKTINLNSDILKVYNSLSGGYIDNRSKAIQKKWCDEISQKSICIIYK